MKGVPKTQLLGTSIVPSGSVSKGQEDTVMSDPGDASHKNGNSSGRQDSPAAIHMQMPVGDACREDGTLKDASEMVWLNSPSDENSHLEANEKRSKSHSSELEWPDSPSEAAKIRRKRKRDDYNESESNSEDDKPHRAKVSK